MATPTEKAVPPVVKFFDDWVEKNPNDAIAVAAINALTDCIKTSDATTIMHLQIHLKGAAEQLLEAKSAAYKAIQLQAACDLFVLHVTRTARLDLQDLEAVKLILIERGERFSEQSRQCRQTIAELGSHFFHDAEVILTHGQSNVVTALFLRAAALGKRFRVIVTEAQPGRDGLKTVKLLRDAGLTAELIIDSAVGFVMDKVDMVVVGAQGVVENGGIINKIGTNQMAIVAAANKKPFYVAAESYKVQYVMRTEFFGIDDRGLTPTQFARLYPLNQSDLPEIEKYMYLTKEPSDVDDVMMREPILDYTPPQYITLLFTDLGVLTPSAVSDELIKLYY